jgi:hypothetical protein
VAEQQQSSAARVAGKNVRDFHYKGFRYWLTQPLTMGKYADEETLVIWKRRDPGEFAGKMIQRLPLTYHQGVLNAAALVANGGIPTEDEWTNYGHSMWKKAYRLWVCLDPRHKQDPQTKLSLNLIDGVEWCLRILYDAAQSSEAVGRDLVADIEMKCMIVSQEAAIKNWDSPPDPEVSGGETQEEKSSVSTAGPGFSSTLQSDTTE